MGMYGMNITTEEYEQIFNFLETPKTKHDIMAKFNYGTSKSYDLLSVLVSAGEVKKIKSSGGKTLYVFISKE